MLTTKTKIALAGLAYRTIAKSRGLLGKSRQVEVRRGGVRWNLNLEEGIDFSIYLLGAFERSTVATLRELVKAGDVVLDIGANIGAHTLGRAKNVGAAGGGYGVVAAGFPVLKIFLNIVVKRV